jgi:two-component system chemotaxis family response regulator WspR
MARVRKLPPTSPAVVTPFVTSQDSNMTTTSQSETVSCVVLLVDDHPGTGDDLRQMLANETDIQLHCCRDADEALAMAPKVKPTVILQDLDVPDGALAPLTRYRTDATTRDVPVMVLSSTEDPVAKSDAFTAGASDYLIKLPDRVELVARIRLHSRARLNQLQRDAAHRALREGQERLLVTNEQLVSLNHQLELATETLKAEATYDALSGLLNRRAFSDSLQRELARSRRTGDPVALIIGDIDHFKRINDTHGHMVGDAVIREVARRLRSTVRASDAVGRYGGEDCPPEAAAALAERLRKVIAREPFVFADGLIEVTMSLGVAMALESHDGEDIMRAGDQALYRAKRSGRNRVELALPA